MTKLESFDELKSLDKPGVKKLLDKSPNLARFIEEAFENPKCIIFENNDYIYIIAYVESIASAGISINGGKPYGLYIHPFADEICVWMAEKDGSLFIDGYSAGHYSINSSLDEVISQATNVVNQCDYCKKNVGLENLVRIAFCNKSCKDCEARARATDMKPGWSD